MISPHAAPASLSSRLDALSPDSSAPLELPAPWTPGARPPVPLLASVVPVLGAVALWLVTGSLLALWLAALGPLIAVATMLDGARSARRDRRRAHVAEVAARERVASAIDERHLQERERRWGRHPDVATFVRRDAEIWRQVRGRADALVIGAGVQPSDVRVTGGGDDPESSQLRRRAAALTDAPVIVPAAAGIVVAGNAVLGSAVVRALALQLCMSLAPGELRIAGTLRGEHQWAEALPHRVGTAGLTMALVGPGEQIPPDADLLIVRIEPGTPPPPRCRVVVTVSSPSRAVVDFDGDIQESAPEAVGLGQAEAIAAELNERARRSFGAHDSSAPVALGPLLHDPPLRQRGALPAVIGREAGEPRIIDLVADGPHAIVAGVTGAGKSELLVTWIVSLCATHSTADVSFLLADFKGGTAFDALADLPHVTGVITDLDGSGARRAIESLRAEVRWREAELARSGARDILDARVELPRLVIVVDEFAALLGDHPELHAVFSDVAARGRALGMHLVLGTQRPSGVVRESLLANCPLRISLRVSDAADSRTVLGTSDAAELPGGTDGRGLALVRTSSDQTPRRVRIALSTRDDFAAVSESHQGPRPRRPWLPDLPPHIELDELHAFVDTEHLEHSVPGNGQMLMLGLADEPEHQRQRAVGFRIADRGVLVVGGAGSGKSTVLQTIAAQVAGEVIVVPSNGEGAWDAVARLSDSVPVAGTVVVIDDLDAMSARLPHEYSRELFDRLERVVRGAGDAGILVVAGAQRLGSAITRLAELLPRRVVLGAASRAEYLAVGGDAAHYTPGEVPGRARLDGRAVQIATTATHARISGVPAAGERPWHPTAPVTGFVLRRSPAARAALAAWEGRGAHIITLETFVADTEWAADGPVVVAGEPDDWQRQWRALTAVRSDHDLVIDVACAAELRQLTGERALPPFCEPGRERAWLLSAGGAPVRITMPAVDRHPLFGS